ncbi:MAG TPA: hypothetical protein VFM68_02250 [Candidatus Saccharimonadales bacterium]|nr:hypothetical protein [Candidatus Saccharimonadales bacterium]
MIKSIVFSTILLAAIIGSPTSAHMKNSVTNQASYWGDTCVKTEMGGDVRAFTAPQGATKVIVKGGPDYVVYNHAPFSQLTAPANPNNKHGKTYGISHVIVCSEPKVVATHTAAPTKKRVATTPPVISKKSVVANKASTVDAVATPDEKVTTALPLPSALPETGGVNNLLVSIYALLAGITTYAGTRMVRSKQIHKL